MSRRGVCLCLGVCLHVSWLGVCLSVCIRNLNCLCLDGEFVGVWMRYLLVSWVCLSRWRICVLMGSSPVSGLGICPSLDGKVCL